MASWNDSDGDSSRQAECLFRRCSGHCGWGGNIYGVLFCFAGTTIVLLHGFQKKSQKTPKADVELARRRMKGIEET